MSTEFQNLENTNCDVCKKPILIIRSSPSSIKDKEFSNGMYLFTMDQDYHENHFQNICDVCANNLCKEGLISIGFDGDGFDAIATERYFFDERSQLRYDRC